jgi:4-hydroxy-4-methyl-2-oxoglutarate aldolase
MTGPATDPDKNVQRASKLDTPSTSDALDRLGIAGQCLNTKPLDHRFRLTGRAFTILYGPAGTPPGTVGYHHLQTRRR